MVLNMIGHRERWIKLLPQTRSSEVDYSLLIMTGMVKTLERSEVQPGMAPVAFAPPIFIGGGLLCLCFGVSTA
jgi:hypothetical protein